MPKAYDFEIRVSRKEYSALMDIRGLQAGAHSMVMCADSQQNGDWILRGSDDDFDELLSDLDEEIGEGLAPKKNVSALQRVREAITPEDDDGNEPYTTDPG